MGCGGWVIWGQKVWLMFICAKSDAEELIAVIGGAKVGAFCYFCDREEGTGEGVSVLDAKRGI